MLFSSSQNISYKARQTGFTVYRHRPHGILDFPKYFQIVLYYMENHRLLWHSSVVGGQTVVCGLWFPVHTTAYLDLKSE